jgi:hypothetical protein
MASEPEATIMKFIISLLDTGLQYIGLVIIAVFGGIIDHLTKLRSGEIPVFKLIALLIDIIGSGFAGIIVALIAMSADLRIELVFALAGISGHYGARTLYILQAIIAKKLDKSDKSDK